MSPTIILFNEQTATISIGLKYGCLTVDDVATFAVSEQACQQWVTTCVPATQCSPAKYTKTLVQPTTINFFYVGKDLNGRAKFNIPAVIKTSTQKYWSGIMTMCGRTVKVNLQKSDLVKIESVLTSVITGYVNYPATGAPIGQVATITTGCLQAPNGFLPMKDALGNIIGYAPTEQGDGFCKPYTQTFGGCSVVYLKDLP